MIWDVPTTTSYRYRVDWSRGSPFVTRGHAQMRWLWLSTMQPFFPALLGRTRDSLQLLFLVQPRLLVQPASFKSQSPKEAWLRV